MFIQWQGDVGQYVLHLVKQPGVAPYPVIVRVHLPDRGTCSTLLSDTEVGRTVMAG